MVRRDTGQKAFVKDADILTTVEQLLQEIQDNMLAKAKAVLADNTTFVKSYDEFKSVLEDKGGFLKAVWCGNPECEKKVKDETGATIRVLPFEKIKPQSGCLVCGKAAIEVAYFARSY